jgi:transposase
MFKKYDQNQQFLLPLRLESFIPEDHIARILNDIIGVPSKVHSRQLVKIQPEERLATTSELNPTPSLVTG